MSAQLSVLPIALSGSIAEDPLVMIPVEHDNFVMRTILEGVVTDYGLPADRCVIEMRDLSGTLTDYAFALPLSLALEAGRRRHLATLAGFAFGVAAVPDAGGALGQDCGLRTLVSSPPGLAQNARAVGLACAIQR
jgi:hypothetical protein